MVYSQKKWQPVNRLLFLQMVCNLYMPTYFLRMMVYAMKLNTPPVLQNMTAGTYTSCGGVSIKDQIDCRMYTHHWIRYTTTNISITCGYRENEGLMLGRLWPLRRFDVTWREWHYATACVARRLRAGPGEKNNGPTRDHFGVTFQP